MATGGIDRYAVTKCMLDEYATRGAYNRYPAESKSRIFQHLVLLYHYVFDKDLDKPIRNAGNRVM